MRQVRATAVGLLAGVALSLPLLFPAAARPANPVLIAKSGYHDAYKISLTFVSGRSVGHNIYVPESVGGTKFTLSF